MRGARRQRGVALLIVIWVLALLAAVAASVTAETRTGLQLARNQVENARARALAEAGISLGVLGLVDPNPATQWQADGRARRIGLGGGEILVALQDEAGKIDINAAPDEVLAALLVSLGLDSLEAAALVDAIGDWRDPDDLRRPRGAEAVDYRRAGLDHVPANRPFAVVAELRQVIGMTAALYERVAPLVTVYSHATRINPMTAPAAVLGGLPGVNPAAVAAYVAARAARPTGLPAVQLPPLPGAERLLLPVAAQPRAVTIRAEATTDGGALFVREAVVMVTHHPTSPYAILEWRQGDPSVALTVEGGTR